MSIRGDWVRADVSLRGASWTGMVAGGAIALTWFAFSYPALIWLWQAIQEAAQFNLLVLSLGGLLLMVQGFRYRQHLQLGLPILRPVPLGLMLGSAIAIIALRWLLDFEQLVVALTFIGTYGLLGLFLQPVTWQRGLPIAGAIAFILPFGVQFNTGLGFPARILTAHVVESMLRSWHIAAISSEDIIVLENGIAHVDLPCSGLKSLWTGTLFFMAATWLESRRVGFRWLLIAAANLGFLVIANIARVLTLVVLTHVLQQPAIADMLHVPLGVLSFSAACLFTWVLLRWVPRQDRSTRRENPPSAPSRLSQWLELRQNRLMWVLPVLLVMLTLIPQPAMLPVESPVPHLQWSAAMQTHEMPLNPYERKFFADFPGAIAHKQHFEFEGLTGSMMLVSSSSWRAHHAPELCFVANGFQVDHMQKQDLTQQVTGRWLSLDQGDHSAAYWFQSPHRTTDDFLVRIWDEVSRRDRNWVMVSLLFDTPQQPQTAAVGDLVNEIHGALAHAFEDA